MRSATIAELPPPPPGRTGWPWTEETRQVPDTLPNGSPWPRVSILTPSYNQAQFIEETIRSVLLQGYPNLEYIIIDGGSTDGSVDIICKYEPWLAHWVSEPDDGQSDALNKGLRQAQGEVTGWLNADDTYCPGAAVNAAGYLATHLESAAVYSDCNVVDESGATQSLLKAGEFSLRRLVFRNFIPQPTVFVRRDILEEVGGWNGELHFIMDYDLWMRIGLRQHTMQYLPGTWANFRLHADSKTTSQPGKFRDETVISLDHLFSDPGLSPQLAHLGRKAIGFTYLGAACAGYAEKRIDEAQVNLVRAIQVAPEIVEDYDQLMRVLLSNVLREEDPIQYLRLFFDHLPEPAARLVRLRNRALSDLWVQQAFRSYWDGDFAIVPGVLAKAICHRPAWLRNRGVASILARSLLRTARARPPATDRPE